MVKDAIIKTNICSRYSTYNYSIDTKSGDNMNKRIIMHIDANSAYLSWQAAYDLQKGSNVDLRDIPSVVGGSQEDRRGIVLAKSIPAKAFGIQTGEVIWQARQKCPGLVVIPPNYELYMKASNALYSLIKDYSPEVQRFSVDEMFLDYTGMETFFGEPIEAAHKIKDMVKKELGFTVNIGIGENKLTAKIAGDFKKPDMVHTLYNNEIPSKMWILPVEDLFMVGRKTKKKLKEININTVGDLANADIKFLQNRLKSFGLLLWQYANGIENSAVSVSSKMNIKGIGNSTTIRFDVEDKRTACKVLLSLTESVAMRLRGAKACCSVVSVEIRTSQLNFYSHQRKLLVPTSITGDIYAAAAELFEECWMGEKIRHMGVRVSELSGDDFVQASLFDDKNRQKREALDSAIDSIRYKYGKSSIMRAVLADGEFSPVSGGVGEDDYAMMSSIL